MAPDDWKTTPEYDTTRDYQESFTPTGRRFVVTYHGLDEQLLALRAVQAFGNFAGLDEKSQLPALNAITIVERDPGRPRNAVTTDSRAPSPRCQRGVAKTPRPRGRNAAIGFDQFLEHQRGFETEP
jgi:hypothetical protein